MESVLSHITSLPRLESAAARLDGKALGKQPVDQFTPQQVKIVRASEFISQGDLSRLSQQSSSLQELAKKENQAIRDTPHDGNCWITAANYLFLTQFVGMTPNERETVLQMPTLTKSENIAYHSLLEELDDFLGKDKPPSDDQIMMFMSTDTNRSIIRDFTNRVTHTVPGSYQGPQEITKFASALGIRMRHNEIGTKDQPTTEVGAPKGPISNKTLVQPVGHYVVFETPVERPSGIPFSEFSKTLSHLRPQQNTEIQSLQGYDDIQDAHVDLLERLRTSNDAEKTEITKLISQLEKKEDRLKDRPIVKLNALLTGIQQYSEYLDKNEPSLSELQRKKKLMEFNLEQLKSDKSENRKAHEQAFKDLYKQILLKIKDTKPKREPRTRPVTPPVAKLEKVNSELTQSAIQTQQEAAGRQSIEQLQEELHQSLVNLEAQSRKSTVLTAKQKSELATQAEQLGALQKNVSDREDEAKGLQDQLAHIQNQSSTEAGNLRAELAAAKAAKATAEQRLVLQQAEYASQLEEQKAGSRAEIEAIRKNTQEQLEDLTSQNTMELAVLRGQIDEAQRSASQDAEARVQVKMLEQAMQQRETLSTIAAQDYQKRLQQIETALETTQGDKTKLEAQFDAAVKQAVKLQSFMVHDLFVEQWRSRRELEDSGMAGLEQLHENARAGAELLRDVEVQRDSDREWFNNREMALNEKIAELQGANAVKTEESDVLNKDFAMERGEFVSQIEVLQAQIKLLNRDKSQMESLYQDELGELQDLNAKLLKQVRAHQRMVQPKS